MSNKLLFYFILLPILAVAQPSPNCTQAPYMQCGSNYPVTSNGAGSWLISCNGEAGITVGQETIYKFIAPSSGVFSLQIQVLFGGGTIGGVTYFYREDIPSLECGPNDWKCIGLVNQPGSISFGPLQAGKTYLIAGDANTVGLTMQSISIGDCSATNNTPKSATPVTINADCTVQNNLAATLEPGEPDPDIDPTDGYPGRWLVPAAHTLWFKFAAPANGTVTISATPFPAGKVLDTRIALYEVGDSSNYASYKLLESDDNDTGTGIAATDTLNATIPYTGLTPGKIYYVQLDASYQSTDVQSPFFCLKISNCIKRTNITRCTTAYYQPKVNGLAENKWYGIYTQPKPGDLGQLAAALKPGLQDLDTVFCNIRVTASPQQSYNGIYYMPAYIRLFSKKPVVAPPIMVRMFFTNAEFDSLKIKTGMPTKNIGDLNVSNFSGFQNEDCTPNNNASSGTIQLITNIDTIRMACTQSFFLDFNSTGLGEFGAHFGLLPLPLDMLSLSGRALPEVNRVDWVTSNEQNVSHFLLERSADGITNWTSVGEKAGKGNNNTGNNNYYIDDHSPMRNTFYRIVAVDYDGAQKVSKVISLQRKDDLSGNIQIFPNPATTSVQITWNAATEEKITLRILDMTGRLVQEQQVETVTGFNKTTLAIENLSSGTYFLVVTGENLVSMAVRFVKQ